MVKHHHKYAQSTQSCLQTATEGRGPKTLEFSRAWSMRSCLQTVTKRRGATKRSGMVYAKSTQSCLQAATKRSGIVKHYSATTLRARNSKLFTNHQYVKRTKRSGIFTCMEHAKLFTNSFQRRAQKNLEWSNTIAATLKARKEIGRAHV